MAEDPGDILIIANDSVPVGSLTLAEAQELFLKDRVYWQSTSKATPVNAPEGSVLREDFLRRVLKMSAGDEKEFWEKKKIKTGVVPPPQFENPLKAVYKLQGGVGYVYRSQYRPGLVKILLVVPAQK